ncbi:MAG: hypothetical protein KBS42_05115 [Bacteroidales bacterium]|nr:hypothetical protein [Candidatus Colicola coprequi]
MAKKKQSHHTLAEIDSAITLVHDILAVPVETITISGPTTIANGEYVYTISEQPSTANIHVSSLDVEIIEV